MMFKINSSQPGVRRPVRVEDLQKLWDALSSAFAVSGETRVVSGMNIVDGLVTSGVMAYKGNLYYFDAVESSIAEGSPIYANVVDVDLRTLENGEQIPFYQSNVLLDEPLSENKEQVGYATSEFLDPIRLGVIPDNYIQTNMIADDAIRSRHYQDRSIAGSAVVDPMKPHRFGAEKVISSDQTSVLLRDLISISNGLIYTDAWLVRDSLGSEIAVDLTVPFQLVGLLPHTFVTSLRNMTDNSVVLNLRGNITTNGSQRETQSQQVVPAFSVAYFTFVLDQVSYVRVSSTVNIVE